MLLRILLICLFSLLFNACVTINIYFPAAAAEKAADQIIDQIQGASDSRENTDETDEMDSSEQKEKKPVESGKSQLENEQENGAEKQGESTVLKILPPIYSFTPAITHQVFSQPFYLLITPAYAAANIDISSPAIQTIVDRQAERYKQLEFYYNNGAVGLTDDGLITIRDISQVSLKQRKMVKELVFNENQDRLSLYREIAYANNHPEWEYQIRMIFARRWIERALPGWWYQNEKKLWQQIQ